MCVANLFFAEVYEHPIYQTLASQTSIKDINISVKGAFWPDADRDLFPLDKDIAGKLQRWTNVKDAKIKVNWPDGWDTEDLRVLLMPKYGMKLVSTATGGPVKRKGGAHPTAAPGVAVHIGLVPPKVKVEVPYKIGVQEFVQVWEVEPEPIKKDWRELSREMPTLKIAPETVASVTAMYLNATMVSTILDKQLAYVNQRLSGVVTTQDKTNRFTTKGELLRVRGAILTIALHQQVSRDELFRAAPCENDIFGAPNLGKYGLSKNRLNKLLSLLWKFYEPDESDIDVENEWRYIEAFETHFNEYRLIKFGMSWLMAADELMSWYDGQEGNPTVSVEPYRSNPCLLPKADLVPRKPKPIGKEVKCMADGVSGVMMRLEFQRGKTIHRQQEYFDDYGHTIAQSVRLTKPWHGSNKVYVADAWFGGVTCCEVLRSHGAPRRFR